MSFVRAGMLALAAHCCVVVCACRQSAVAGRPTRSAPAAAPAAAPSQWGSRPVVASAGCGKHPGSSGERTLAVAGAPRAFHVVLPPGYDGTKPYPLVFGFHGATRTHHQCRDADCRGLQEIFGAHAILVYMKSPGERWREESGFERNVSFFDAVLAAVEREQCVDESRVVLAGTSSGAYFANAVACTRAERLLAVVPVGGGMEQGDGCSTPVAALVIHGIDDSHVTFDKGEASRDHYRMRDRCSERTTPAIDEAHRAVRAARDAGQAIYRCVDYSGCVAGVPVRWCEHGEGGWDNSTHAWPTFGGRMIADFLDTLP